MKGSDHLSLLFNRFLNRECSPEELEMLFAYFGTAEEATLRDLIRRELDSQDQALDSPETSEKLNRLYHQISYRINQPVLKRSAKLTSFRRVAAAAAAVLIVAAGFYLWNFEKPVEMKTVHAAYGKLLQLRLPDNSIAWLNAGTTLQYPESFKGESRTLILKSGQVYFEVVPDKRKPFIVTTEALAVTVLGTSFEVSAYEKENDTRVSVSSGKVNVAVADKKNALVLLPGERAVLSKTNRKLYKTTVSTADIAAWRQQKLIFENQPFAEVMQTLERRYNVRITIENPHLYQEKITLRLNNEPLSHVLTALAFSNHFKYTKTNDSLITIK